MRAIALEAIARGAGNWAYELEDLARRQIAKGFKEIGQTIIEGYQKND
jgi:hypothetical protein